MTQPRLVGGRYELGELIGYGGMAEVHRGRDARLGRDVAIKMLRADLARDPSFLNRFRREAQAAAGLNHPSIVSVYDTGEDIGPDGTSQPFIVMEYVEGRTLRDILKAEGRLPARRAMEIVADVCGALEFSHRNGLIHRDIKPANVMITQAGAVKVMDFGIARTLADDAATQTQTANVIGTAQYLSPEQARGETVDGRSDVYSTGCLLYELVTGVPPFQGDSPVAVAYQHVRENAVAPTQRVPDLPRVLDSIVMKSIAKNTLNRYQSAADMRSDLQRALADQPVSAEAVMTDAERTQFIARTPDRPRPAPVPVAEPEYEEPERRTGLIWGSIVAALILVIAGSLLAVALIGNSGDNKPMITVPSGLIGQPLQNAINALNGDALLKQNASGDTNGPCDGGVTPTTENVVCKLTDGTGATVTAGQKIVKGSTIYYQLYKQKQITVPYLKGENIADAIAQLTKLGLDFKQVSPPNGSSQPAGTVLNQNPDVNASLPPGGVVTLTVSQGQLKLPDVKGMTGLAAKTKLNNLGFSDVITNSTTQNTPDKSKDGTVADMSPEPGGFWAPNTPITLTMFVYVPPTPTCSSSSPTGGTPTSGTPTDTTSVLPPCTTP
jgi:serine/threonine-protein kinase